MASLSSHPRRWTWVSPWFIIGSICILAGILIILGFKNVHRERESMVRTLLSEANILIRSLESISRTAMMRMGWGRNQIQSLMEDAAQQPDVLYVALITPQGYVVAHSRPELVGATIQGDPARTDQAEYRFVERERRAFEVSRAFQIGQHRRQMHQSMEIGPHHMAPELGRDLYIVVGLDPTPFEESIRHDTHQMLLLFGVMFLGGAAGFVSLIWAQHYRNVKRSLQDIEAFTSTVLNQMPVGMLATDLNGRIQRTNDAARSILQRAFTAMSTISDFPCFASVAQQLKNEEHVLEEEVHFRGNPSRTVPLLVNAATIRDGLEHPAGYVFLFSDLTNIKQLEEQLRRSERLAALGRLAAGVAHEIRNPLSSIKGFAAILAGKVERDEQASKIAQVMQQEVDRLNRTITELLDFARPTELDKRSCDCLELITHTLELIEGDAVVRGVNIETNVTPDELRMHADADRFSQILLNLYLNALQAMESGGRLSIDVRREHDQVVWTIKDSGLGIQSEHLSHVFDPYFTTKPDGVGLGLAIVHKLVEAHSGDIEVASTPGQGTSFVMRFPFQLSLDELTAKGERNGAETSAIRTDRG